MFTIRRMQLADLTLALEWARAEGWNPGLHDAAAFLGADPAGFFLGEWDGQPVGCISLVKYSPHFAFLGLYIVRPDFRGRGFGLRLWQAAMEYAGAATVGLDGVTAQQENYKKSGFAFAYRNVRLEWNRSDLAPSLESSIPPSVRVEGFHEQRLAAVLALDAEFFPAAREGFLRAWLHPPAGAARVAFLEGVVAGYGVVRRCHHGYKIGPLFARSPEVAEALFLSLSAVAQGEAVYLDLPEPNAAALALAEKYGMKRVFETARMYTRQAPNLPLRGIFGVSTFELG